MASDWGETFEAGEQLATHRFTEQEGLGPKFNVSACTACHESPTSGGGGPLYRNFTLMGQRTNSNAFLLAGTRGGVYTFHHIDDVETEMFARADANVIAERNPIPFFGLGLLALIEDDAILVNADPMDTNADGISGRPNFIAGRIGRLGSKAQATDIEGFVRGPLNNHLGITSDPLPPDLKSQLPFAPVGRMGTVEMSSLGIGTARFAQVAAPNEPLTDDDNIADPEIHPNQLFKLVAWASLLAVPQPETPSALTLLGERHFNTWGCSDCHVPTLPSSHGAIPLYSDLLLHDMGEKLADGIEMGFASGSEFRTAPLWGVVATGPYLHDGRAQTLREAIEMHGGEASESAKRFKNAEPSEQASVIEFLSSLGGRDQASPGLIDPAESPPTVNELGGPISSLDDDEAAAWLEGRSMFDRNFGFSDGLGPAFNGDSCRACHFLGAVGGAGPSDVDVHRLIDTRAGTSSTRYQHHEYAVLPAPLDEQIELERRNTPPLFGLQVLAQVPVSFLESIADPMDLNADGVYGRLAYTLDLSVGRFGWQGQISTIRHFVQDAFVEELGLLSDGMVDPPEISADVIDSVTVYIRSLAPPPIEDDPRMLQQFSAVGCGDCHRIDLPIANAPQPLTNLLLHDIGTGHFEFSHHKNRYRTPPLWALYASAPYLHDGRAPTLRIAIEMHGGEAARSRDNFLALPPASQLALIEFLKAR